ncbi:MAG: glycerate kinase [Solirubrobacteraceae bacterium]
MTRVLVAPDSFKGTFSAAEVADAVGRGLEAAGVEADRCPIADGGEGTMAILVAAQGGRTQTLTVSDPLGRPVAAAIGWIDGGATAIVEMALASGLGLVAPGERDAEAASTAGTGELIAAAVAGGARRIVVSVGGSATTDGGAGAVAAVRAAGGLRGAQLVVACDVTTPFERAAIVYGPQKGADPAAVQRLTARLNAQAAALPRDPRGVPMTGAAGGLAGGLWAALEAELVAGAPWVLDALGFAQRLARADAAVSGEGRLDRQTLEGKAVGEVAARCAAAGVPLHAIVGSSELSADEAQALGLASVRLAPTPADMEAAGRALAAGLARAGSGHAATMTEPRSTLGDADAPPPPEQTTEEVERATRAADPRPKPGTSPEGRHPAAHHLGEEGQADE